jgi:pyruvate-formate lyase-activating enzyme
VSQTQPTAAATHVSAGYICAEPRVEFFRYMDAANIDLKGFTEGFYKLDVLAGSRQCLKHSNISGTRQTSGSKSQPC